MAFGIVLVLTLVLTVGVRETSAFIDIMTMVKLILMVVICIVAFANSEASIFSENFTLPETGPDGVFQAGALLLFSFSAFDAVTVAVEEVRCSEYFRSTVVLRCSPRPAKLQVPVGFLTVLYPDTLHPASRLLADCRRSVLRPFLGLC